MSEKCALCGEKIEEVFLDKKRGTVIKIKENEKNKTYHVCSECQKKFENIEEEVKKLSK